MYIGCQQYENEEFVKMELELLDTLNWKLSDITVDQICSFFIGQTFDFLKLYEPKILQYLDYALTCK